MGVRWQSLNSNIDNFGKHLSKSEDPGNKILYIVLNGLTYNMQ